MKLGSRPMSKTDWRLLLTLARCVRLATKEELAAVLRRWEAEQAVPSPTILIDWEKKEEKRGVCDD